MIFSDAFNADVLLSDTLDNDIFLSDVAPSSFALSHGPLPNGNPSRLSDTIQVTSSPKTPVNKPANHLSSDGDQDAKDAPCSCFAQALGLMKQLFPHPSIYCTTSGENGEKDLLLLPTVPVVIERNRRTVTAISAMLACPCSHDVHLLAIMAHIVFKVLGWYAVAARKTPSTPPPSLTAINPSSKDDGSISISSDVSSTSGSRSSLSNSSSYLEQVCWQAEMVGCYRLDGDDSGRMAAQLVLSELHRVQSLVRELAARLQAQSSTDRSSGSAGSITEQPLLPFSGTILDLLGVDLRKRLKELSVEIVGSLRND